MAKTQLKVFGGLLNGLNAVGVAVGGSEGLVHREVEVEEVVFRFGTTELDDLSGHHLQVVVVVAAQGEPNLGMAWGYAESLLAQDGMRDDESGQRLHLFQELAFLLQMMDEQGQQFRRAVSRLGLGGVCCTTIEGHFQAKRSRRKTALFDHDFTFLEARQVVQAESQVGFDLLKLRVAQYGLSALSGFLSRWEEQYHLALVGALLAEPLGQSAEYGSMPVMAAFV